MPFRALLPIALLIAFLVAFIFIAERLKKRGKGSPGGRQASEPAYRRVGILSPAETAFYHALRAAVGDSLVFFAKVRIADLITPDGAGSRGDWQTAFNRINQKHVDFVLCDPQTLDARLVVELDDASHTPGHRHYRAGRDATVDAALTSAGVPILRVRAAGRYDVASLREGIGSKLGEGGSNEVPRS